jgi:putative transposase
MRYRFIAAHRRVWPTRWMCHALAVSHGGFYGWLKRPESARAQANRRLTLEIRAIHARSDGTYGSPRVWRDLVEAGIGCSENRVARLMRAAQIQARSRVRRHRYRVTGGASLVAPNRLERRFAVPAPNTVWASDITYIWTGEGWLYLAVVIDLFSRAVVGWAMGASANRELVNDALLMAVWRRRPKAELLHHSDQGCQYTSEDFQRLLAANGLSCSMSRRGDCWDNAVVESFFSTLKRERVHRRTYRTRDEAKADLFDYIERFYNPHRRHSTLGQMSPIAFEKSQLTLTKRP